MTEIESQLSERRRQWAEMAPAQQMQRIQTALLGTLDLARWRRMERRRRLATRPMKRAMLEATINEIKRLRSALAALQKGD